MALSEAFEHSCIVELVNDSLYPYELRRVVVDDFYSDPDQIRRFALAARYCRSRDETIWRSRVKLFSKNAKERLARCWGRNISHHQWHNEFNGTFFIACAQGRYKATPFIHFDTPTTFITVIVFLTPGRCEDSGTTFYLHRRTRLAGAPGTRTLRRMNATLADFEETISRDSRRKAAWDVLDQVPYKFNRAIFFPAGLFHSASRNFGATLNDGRLWQSFHFGLKRES